jgi:hypothetical protein
MLLRCIGCMLREIVSGMNYLVIIDTPVFLAEKIYKRITQRYVYP